MYKIKAKNIIFDPNQRLDSELFVTLRSRMLARNPKLYRFIIESISDKDIATRERQVDLTVIGLSLIGAIDRDEEDSNYVLVTEDSIRAAKNKSFIDFCCMIDDFDPIIYEVFKEALDYAYSFGEALNVAFNDAFDSEKIIRESIIFFDAYWQEYYKQKTMGL